MKIVIVDIDGTIADCSERAIKYLTGKEKNWDAFYEGCPNDKPIQVMIDLVLLLAENYEIVFCTGRREGIRQKTINWIEKHVKIKMARECLILMREDGDFRTDAEAKPELLSNAGILLQEIAFVLEDRTSMVKKWRGLGLTCLQVAEGDF